MLRQIYHGKLKLAYGIIRIVGNYTVMYVKDFIFNHICQEKIIIQKVQAL